MTDYEVLNGVGWRPDAEDRGYRAPVAPDPFAAPRVTATAVNGQPGGTVVETTFTAAEHAKKMWQKHIEDTNKDAQFYTTDGYRAQLAKFADTAAAKAAFQSVENLETRANQAAAKLTKIMGGLSPDGDTAGELRASRFWDRTKPLLDNAKEGAVLRAKKLVENATREQLGTLLQELPSYLEARNHTTDWIEAAVSQAVPEYGQAVKQKRNAENALMIAKQNAKTLRQAITDGHAGSPIVLADPRRYDPDK